MLSSRFSAVILAAGKGKRMGGEIPKQYMGLLGKPLVYYTLAAFEASLCGEVILVVNPGDEGMVETDIVDKYGFKKVKSIVPGGAERFDSVFEGLKYVSGTHVLIHDGARILIRPGEIDKMCEAAVRYRAAVAGMPGKDTIKIADENGFVEATPDRSKVWIIQTPQAFELSLVRAAYESFIRESGFATDDAGVVERYTSAQVKLVPVSYENIKVTTPEDMVFAETVLKGRRNCL